MFISPILRADSYKASHFMQYPENTEYVSSYIESRGGKFDNTVFFGLQMFLKEYLSKPITHTDIDHAKARITAHGEPFNEAGWRHIVDAHGGYLPVKIEALPEGSTVPTKTPMVQIVNTDPKCYWLTSYLETALLRAVWYPTTVATLSAMFKATMKEVLDRTSDHPEGVNFMLQDFGARGVSSGESAGLGGSAHLVNFMGTDTMEALEYTTAYYGADMAGFSIPAAEHSTMTAKGREGELQQITRMLDQFLAPGKIVAIVSDSYDLWNVIDNYFGKALKDRIMNSGGRVVVRPDSGDPVAIVPEAIERLMVNYGCTVNSKGFKVLPDCIRVIQGDGVSLDTVKEILLAMEKRGLSAENIVFGCGGELLQKVNRDTLKFAQKASAMSYDGQWHDIFKDPLTDPGKRSKAGRFAVLDDVACTVIQAKDLNGRGNQLKNVWENGRLLIDQAFDVVRTRAVQSAWRLSPSACTPQ